MKKFNPSDYLPENARRHECEKANAFSHSRLRADFDTILRRVDRDIAPDYLSQWLPLGFALAREFGESGRQSFYYLSQFHGTSWEDCNRQYDKCLKSKRTGYTIKTFYYLCKQAGIKIT